MSQIVFKLILVDEFDFYDIVFEDIDMFDVSFYFNQYYWGLFERFWNEDFVYFFEYEEFGCFWFVICYVDIMVVDINY